MSLEVLQVANPMIRKPALPNLHSALKLLLNTERESALGKLDGALECDHGRDQNVKVVGHQHVLVQQVGAATVGVKRLKKQAGPWGVVEERPPLPCRCRDKLGLLIVRDVFARGFQNQIPPGLKPRLL
jgi:hypothetical protein